LNVKPSRIVPVSETWEVVELAELQPASSTATTAAREASRLLTALSSRQPSSRRPGRAVRRNCAFRIRTSRFSYQEPRIFGKIRTCLAGRLFPAIQPETMIIRTVIDLVSNFSYPELKLPFTVTASTAVIIIGINLLGF
jgi:hypothetical protein